MTDAERLMRQFMALLPPDTHLIAIFLTPANGGESTNINITATIPGEQLNEILDSLSGHDLKVSQRHIEPPQ